VKLATAATICGTALLVIGAIRLGQAGKSVQGSRLAFQWKDHRGRRMWMTVMRSVVE